MSVYILQHGRIGNWRSVVEKVRSSWFLTRFSGLQNVCRLGCSWQDIWIFSANEKKYLLLLIMVASISQYSERGLFRFVLLIPSPSWPWPARSLKIYEYEVVFRRNLQQIFCHFFSNVTHPILKEAYLMLKKLNNLYKNFGKMPDFSHTLSPILKSKKMYRIPTSRSFLFRQDLSEDW